MYRCLTLLSFSKPDSTTWTDGARQGSFTCKKQHLTRVSCSFLRRRRKKKSGKTKPKIRFPLIFTASLHVKGGVIRWLWLTLTLTFVIVNISREWLKRHTRQTVNPWGVTDSEITTHANRTFIRFTSCFVLCSRDWPTPSGGFPCRALRLSDRHKAAWFITRGCPAQTMEGFQFKSSQGHVKYNYNIIAVLQAHFQPLWAQEINFTRSQSVALSFSKAVTFLCTVPPQIILQKEITCFSPLSDYPEQKQELPFSIHGHKINWKIMITIGTAITPCEMLFLKQALRRERSLLNDVRALRIRSD